MIPFFKKLFAFEHSTFITAEIGINHNGDIELAKKMILAAKNAGADAIKFQNYKVDDFILDHEIEYEYLSGGNLIKESQYEMFKRYELNFNQLRELKLYSDSIGIIFFSTPTSSDGIQELADLNVKFLKNGSDFLQNLSLIKAMAKSGLPTILSTGMASLAQIDDAVRVFEENGGKDLIILHCISQYPTPLEDVNLKKITSLSKSFGYPVGFSDHTEGNVASIGATILGACFLEKHFTLSKDLPGPDHRFSSSPEEFKKLVDGVRSIEKAIGSSKLTPTNSELINSKDFKLSCVAKKDIPKGKLIKESDIAFSRPGGNLSPKMIDFILDKRINKNIEKGKPFTLSDFNDN